MLNVGVCSAIVSVPCSLVVTCWERADLLAVVFVVFCHFWHRETGLSPPVKCFSDHPKAVHCTSFVDHLCFSVLCLLCLCVCLFICALWSPAGKGLTSWLSFVVSNC